MDLYDFFLHNNSSNYLFGKIEEEGKTDDLDVVKVMILINFQQVLVVIR